MPRPVVPGRKPSNKSKSDSPRAAEKASERAKLAAKGVPARQASHLVGEGENVTRLQIAERRIAWQKTLPKA